MINLFHVVVRKIDPSCISFSACLISITGIGIDTVKNNYDRSSKNVVGIGAVRK